MREDCPCIVILPVAILLALYINMLSVNAYTRKVTTATKPFTANFNHGSHVAERFQRESNPQSSDRQSDGLTILLWNYVRFTVSSALSFFVRNPPLSHQPAANRQHYLLKKKYCNMANSRYGTRTHVPWL